MVRPSFYNAGKGNVMAYFEENLVDEEMMEPLDASELQTERAEPKTREEMLEEYRQKKSNCSRVKVSHQEAVVNGKSSLGQSHGRRPRAPIRPSARTSFASSLPPSKSRKMFELEFSPPKAKRKTTNENIPPKNAPRTSLRKRAEWSQKSSRRQPLGDDRPFDALSKGMHIEDKHLQTKKELSDTLTQLVESEKENEKLSAELIDATEKLDKLESEKTFIQEALKKERESSTVELDEKWKPVLQELGFAREKLSHTERESSMLLEKFRISERRQEKLTADLESAETQISQYMESNYALKMELSSVQEKFNQIETQKNQLQLENQINSEKWTTTEKNLQRMLTETQAQLSHVEAQWKQSDVEKTKLQQEVEQMRERNSIETDILNQALVQKETECFALQEQSDMTHEELHQTRTDCVAKLRSMAETLQKNEDIRRRLHNKVMELKGNIRVFCRVRPVLDREMQHSSKDADVFRFPDKVEEARQIELTAARASHVSYRTSDGSSKKWAFDFDRVFGPSTTQEKMFLEVSALVQSAMDGYRVCIFAYGQTGSGKTYTMQGNVNSSNASSIGIVARTVGHIFDVIEERRDYGWEYSVELEMLELYNDTFRDLIASDESSKAKIELRLDRDGNSVVTNLSKHKVRNQAQVLEFLRRAALKRSTKQTNCNDYSSRSHSIVSLRLRGINQESREERDGIVHLVDLAGSERLSKSGSGNDALMLKEAQAINKSLSCLGTVICAIAKKECHIPFRNSKLTHVLQPSLGGDCKTLMICTLSPLPIHRNESLNTLRFAKTVNSCEVTLSSVSRK